MGFSGGQGIFEVLGDEIWGATGPGTEISALDRSKKSGRQGDKSTGVKEIGKVLFFLSVADGSIDGMVSEGKGWYRSFLQG